MDENTRDTRRLLTVPEVAARLGQHRSSIYRKLYSGELPAVRLGGRGAGLRVDERDLHEFVYGGSDA